MKRKTRYVMGTLVVCVVLAGIVGVVIWNHKGINPASKDAVTGTSVEPVSQEAIDSGEVVVEQYGDEKEELANWNMDETISKTKGDYQFKAYLSDDEKECWIYKIKVLKEGTKEPLDLPNKIKECPVTKLGGLEAGDSGFYENLFGVVVESAHGCGGESEATKNISKIQFPNTLKEIGSSAFSGLDNLKRVDLPENLASMEGDVFYSCDNLEQVQIPKGYNGLCNGNVFGNCYKIKKIQVAKENETYKSIDNLLYSKNGTSLIWAPPGREDVIIPEGVKTIETGAFADSKILNVSIPASVDNMETRAFHECYYMQNIALDSKNEAYKMDGNSIYENNRKRLIISIVKDGKLTISPKIEIIPGEAVMVGGMKKGDDVESGVYVAKVDIPTTVKTLEGDWDDFCSNNEYSAQGIYFQSMTPPEYVQGSSESSTMHSYRELYIPVQAEDKYRAWFPYDRYETYTQGTEATSKDFKYLKGSDRVEILKYVGNGGKVIIPDKIEGRTVTFIGRSAFENAKIQSVVVPDTVTEIEARAFMGCKSLESVVLPKSLEMLHGKTFKNCKSLVEIVIPDTVTSIHLECFKGCTKLVSVTMPAKLKEAQGSIFYKCKSLKSIVIPQGLELIPGEMFYGCVNLEAVDIQGDPHEFGYAVFYNCKKLKKLKDIQIKESVPWAIFYNCQSLETTVEIMPNCLEVGANAFYNCPGVKVKNIENAKYVDKDIYNKRKNN